MSLSYAWEKFHIAVLTLAGTGSTKERLSNAYIFSIGHIKTSEDIPADLREKFENLCDTLTSVDPTGQEGKVQATIAQMDELEISKVTEDIISFYDTLCRRLALEDGTH
ncbi:MULTISPECIES: hypothetical protein [Citrobacter]|uniref:hypothetical protein n=1 Tax=Citrobacter TaxID=544 RepID=UPI00190522C2|nr:MULTISPECIES: hypothetical protein [Citrobacter]MBJ9886425.1 hypothetical protein [Citrobacter sp. FDAARGOS_156]MCL7684474.1 hypothetical protein [Citrobacter youngae]UTD17883.1 hypothetical protein G8S19_05295 [Citrobacter sp. SX206]UTD22174.1 hypothetical protein G8S20_05295 [Citrobacter sp. SX212]